MLPVASCFGYLEVREASPSAGWKLGAGEASARCTYLQLEHNTGLLVQLSMAWNTYTLFALLLLSLSFRVQPVPGDRG